jgi:rhodanese-related sulfurtransferase
MWPRRVGVVAAMAWALGLAAWPAAPAHAGHGNLIMVLDADYVRAQYQKGRKLTAIDLRSPDDYRRGHLPGARSLPLDQLTARFEEVPKTNLVVLYCDCPRSEIEVAYWFLRQRQYRNLSVMGDGFKVWEEREFPIER